METLIEAEVKEIVEVHFDFQIKDKNDLARVFEGSRKAKSLESRIEQELGPDIDKAHKLHKSLVAKKKSYLKPIEDFRDRCDQAIIEYNKKLEDEQREIERIANEQLAKAAEAKKQKLLDKANESSEWDAEVLKEKAQEIKPITVDVQKKIIEQEGLSIRRTWKARIVDSTKIPRKYLIIDQGLLNAAAKIESIRKEGIPGVEFIEEQSASVRS